MCNKWLGENLSSDVETLDFYTAAIKIIFVREFENDFDYDEYNYFDKLTVIDRGNLNVYPEDAQAAFEGDSGAVLICQSDNGTNRVFGIVKGGPDGNFHTDNFYALGSMTFLVIQLSVQHYLP